MKLFIFGFMCCWIVFAILNILADRYSWFHSYEYIYGTTAPILIPIIVICYLFKVIYSPWSRVIKSVPQSQFNSEVERVRMKVLHIGRFKICYNKTTKWINRLFFVRIEKGT
jgi:hypothetical protein